MVWLSRCSCASRAEGTPAAAPASGAEPSSPLCPVRRNSTRLWICTKPCCSVSLQPHGIRDVPFWPQRDWEAVPASLRLQPCQHSPARSPHQLPSASLGPCCAHTAEVLKKAALAVLLWACCAPSRDTTLGHPEHRACVQPSFSFSPRGAEKSEF